MYIGKDFGKACDQAKANTRIDGKPRYLHTYNGSLWLSVEAPRCEHWMVTPQGEVITIDADAAKEFHDIRTYEVVHPTAELPPVKQEYKSLAAREAKASNYGSSSYWDYLDQHAEEMSGKGVADAYTRTLSQALAGNNGN